MFYYNKKKLNNYPRRDINEKIEGLKGVYYKLLDKKPQFNDLTQYLKEDKIITTKELFKNIPHLKIAYQTYKVIDKTQNELEQELDDNFGNWIDSEYPLWKRQKHSDELNRDIDIERRQYIQSWKDWEFEQRELLKNKIINKDYIFNFNPKN